jgi:translation initiation factor 4A
MEPNKPTEPEDAQAVQDALVEDEKLLESNWTEVVESFEDMKLKKDLLRGIFGYGFVKPSSIQQRGIMPLVMKRDTIAQAQSGSGVSSKENGYLFDWSPAEHRLR